ncbi:MAG: hypothetical protein ACRENE_00780 [Polyangiaceae bacterium]
MNVRSLGAPAAATAAPARAMAGDDKATVRPPFDPAEFARQSELSTMPPTGMLATQQSPDDPVISTESTHEVLFVDADTVPMLAVAREDLEWFDLAQPVRDLLKHVDGEAKLSTVCSRARRTLEDGVSLIEQLVRDGVLACK